MPVYLKQTWVDGPAGHTPLSAARLQYIEDGIAAVETALTEAVAAEQSRAQQSEQQIGGEVNAEIARAGSAENALAVVVASETTRAQAAEQALGVADADPGTPSLRTLGVGTQEAAPGRLVSELLIRLTNVESILGLLALDGGSVAEDVVVTTDDGGSPSDTATVVIDGGTTDQLLLVDGGTP